MFTSGNTAGVLGVCLVSLVLPLIHLFSCLPKNVCGHIFVPGRCSIHIRWGNMFSHKRRTTTDLFGDLLFPKSADQSD